MRSGECVASFSLYRNTISRLQLQRGDIILDVARGTGLCFSLIIETISPPKVTSSGSDEPWSILKRFVPDLQTESLMYGGVYIGSGNHASAQA